MILVSRKAPETISLILNRLQFKSVLMSFQISEPDKPLLATKYTQRDKSLRLNHGGWDRNEKAEKVQYLLTPFDFL